MHLQSVHPAAHPISMNKRHGTESGLRLVVAALRCPRSSPPAYQAGRDCIGSLSVRVGDDDSLEPPTGCSTVGVHSMKFFA